MHSNMHEYNGESQVGKHNYNEILNYTIEEHKILCVTNNNRLISKGGLFWDTVYLPFICLPDCL